MALRISELKPSAFRHGISEERIRHVVRHATRLFDVPAHPTIEGSMVLIVGLDAAGIPLEVMAREDREGRLTVFHAMRMSRRYEALLREQGDR